MGMHGRRVKVPETLKDAYRAARKAGWTVTRTGSNHLKWAPPDGIPVFTGGSPSSARRSRQNAESALRKAGLTW